MKAKAAAIAAGALALTLGTTMAASANDGPVTVGTAHAVSQHSSRSAFSASPNAAAAAEPIWALGIDGRDSAGNLWDYGPRANGGFDSKENMGNGFGPAKALFKNNPANDENVNLYANFGGTLHMYPGNKVIGTGWSIYNTFVTPGNLGGAAYPDLLARDSAGVLWEYLSNKDGTFTGRRKVGGGWNAFTQITGRGDLNGDGKPDIVARDKSGVLWMYKGTGLADAPLNGNRVRIGGGWNTYNKILGLGDSNGDAVNDLIARDSAGVLYVYAGTGTGGFHARAKIGTGWNAFNYLF
ncbi:VCBS repeat-containing protein [Streptomyces cocklensis]|uniref:N-acetylmuramoyl-L-alanine amidase n=1 Tax=Actinacidiphila cocklensis TaxID=887465 RepID=A0A9W4E3F5_9ACTN|nr:VCBS repeat-containing protein [Actinacidiphila cocklensis]MDD1061196.1 VCBS repeat-containing protein [Actinacidiphila cocklensis]CAG6398737.1 N-acetylmuramoyl-L-alanine amidase [Actinacidiphila cocklensis]